MHSFGAESSMVAELSFVAVDLMMLTVPMVTMMPMVSMVAEVPMVPAARLLVANGQLSQFPNEPLPLHRTGKQKCPAPVT